MLSIFVNSTNITTNIETAALSNLISKLSLLLVIQSSICYTYRLMLFHKKKMIKNVDAPPIVVSSRAERGKEIPKESSIISLVEQVQATKARVTE